MKFINSNHTSFFQINTNPPFRLGCLTIILLGKGSSPYRFSNPSLSNHVSIRKQIVGACFLTILRRLRPVQKFLSPWQFQLKSLIASSKGDSPPLPMYHEFSFFPIYSPSLHSLYSLLFLKFGKGINFHTRSFP